MANLPRKLQKIFGVSLTPTGNIAQFGSLKAGSPAYSGDLDDIQTTAWLSAWNAALINAPGGLASPALQDMNAILYVLSQQIAYLTQKGIADYLATEEYFQNDYVKVGGVVYISKTDNNTGNDPVTDTNNWKTLQSTFGTAKAEAKAWVNFNGRSGTIYDSLNVSSITKTATACYILNFTNPIGNANYVFAGSCGNLPGGSYASGNEAVLLGAFAGKTTVKTANALSVFTKYPGDPGLIEADMVSVIIFGS